MQRQGPYKIKKTVYRRPRTSPTPPKRCEIVATATGMVFGDPFPSRRQADKALAALILALPPKNSPDELDRYWIRNV